jgi:hypothetical protein
MKVNYVYYQKIKTKPKHCKVLSLGSPSSESNRMRTRPLLLSEYWTFHMPRLIQVTQKGNSISYLG